MSRPEFSWAVQATKAQIRAAIKRRGAKCRIDRQGNVKFKNPGFRRWGDGGHISAYRYTPDMGAFTTESLLERGV